MFTQPFSSLETTTPKLFTTENTEEHREESQGSTGKSACATQTRATSLLDEPWKVTLVPAGAPVGEDPHAAKSLPWHVGDVTRLKDDSPKGMMEYIATHSTGWWREMAERALRDTEKAERMAHEAGWEYGQYWALKWMPRPSRSCWKRKRHGEHARKRKERRKRPRSKHLCSARWSCWRRRGGLRGASTSTRTGGAADRHKSEANGGATGTRR
jgi:hypothetical protein